MFGEADSESPRVPSPWDSLISASPVPRLVPENDSGNVEYKLQLISPSATRFARLVTQLKWRLLEGGGQAYYELGVADSGILIGLGKTEMEASLETLEMMAGEIGASVVVVKEIVVPEAMVLAAQAQQAAGLLLGDDKDKWMRTRRRGRRKGGGGCADGDDTSTTPTTTTTTTDTTAAETTEGEEEDLSATVMLYRPTHSIRHTNSVLPPGFTMDPDPDPDPAEIADGEQEEPESEPIPNIVIDIEISAVFKPRPMRTRIHSAHPMNQAARNKRQKKQSKPVSQGKETQPHAEGGKSRRHRRRDRKRTASLQPPPVPVHGNKSSGSPSPSPAVSMESPAMTLTMAEEADALVSKLEALHVSVELGDDMLGMGMSAPTPAFTYAAPVLVQEPEAESFVVVEEDHDITGDDDDVFPTPFVPPITANFEIDSGRVNEATGNHGDKGEQDLRRVIVEALVVRKMCLEEAFLDFGAFS